jgi:2-polyprenyl-3-methyl-5-hydroxy-6-metoxy-1,4-benzoquinol methylase
MPHQVSWTPERVARIWGYYARSPAYTGLYFSRHAGGAILDRVARQIPLRGRRVLDFGCGRGDLLEHLFDRGIAASGLEFSSDSAAVANERFAANALFRGVVTTERLPTPLGDQSFDVVFLVEVVEHLLEEQIQSTLTEVRRLLAPGGHVVATTPNEERLEAEVVQCPDCGAEFHRWQHQRSLDPRSIARMFEPYGFTAQVAQGVHWGVSRRALWRERLSRTAHLPHLLYIGTPV